MRRVRTILVTGGAGFIGSVYLNQMVPKYPHYRFINVDALTYAGSLKNIEVSRAKNYSFEKADIRDLRALDRIFKKYKPTDVIHFAAESHVDVSIKNPSIFVETNVVGTHNLLQLAKQYGLKRFLNVSTDEVYGSLSVKERSSREDDALAPNSPYSASKAGAEALVRAYHETFGLDTVITRASNTYGPNQHQEKFIPLFISQLLRNKKAPLYGTGKNIRNWLYVEDHASGIDAAFHKGKAGEVYNLAGTVELHNIDVARTIAKLLGKPVSLIKLVKDRPGHDLRYSLNSSKARKELGWKPRTAFSDGLLKTMGFYKNDLRA